MKIIEKIAKEILREEKTIDVTKFPKLPKGFKISYDSAFGTGAKAWVIKNKDPRSFVTFWDLDGNIGVTFIKKDKEIKHVWEWKESLEKLFSDAVEFLK